MTTLLAEVAKGTVLLTTLQAEPTKGTVLLATALNLIQEPALNLIQGQARKDGEGLTRSKSEPLLFLVRPNWKRCVFYAPQRETGSLTQKSECLDFFSIDQNYVIKTMLYFTLTYARIYIDRKE